MQCYPLATVLHNPNSHVIWKTDATNKTFFSTFSMTHSLTIFDFNTFTILVKHTYSIYIYIFQSWALEASFSVVGEGMCTDRGHELYISVRNIAKCFLCLHVFSRYFPAILITNLISAFFFHGIIIGIK